MVERFHVESFVDFCKQADAKNYEELIKQFREHIGNISNVKDIRDKIEYIVNKDILIECIELGHANSATDYSHSYISLFLPNELVQKCMDNGKEDEELAIYVIDWQWEMTISTEEHAAGKLPLSDIKREKCNVAVIADKGYFNYMIKQYPLYALYELKNKNELIEEITSKFVMVKIRYYLPGNHIDRVLATVLSILN